MENVLIKDVIENIASPIGVVIGDSIAIGYYDSKLQPYESRLQPSFDPSFINPPGTFAYEFQNLTNFTWYNQGIGGQTTDELWQRWCRDALALDFDAGDGRGNKTLIKKPSVIILDTGTSELRNATPDSVSIIKNNIYHMVKTATENNISVIVINIAPIKTTDNAKIIEVNTWMLNTLTQFGDRVRIYDAYSKLSIIGYKDFQLDRNNHFYTNLWNYIAGFIYSYLRSLNFVDEANTTLMLDKKYNWGDGCHWTALAVRDVASEIVTQNPDIFLQVLKNERCRIPH